MSTALLAALMEPAVDQEDEFNDWYDDEHLPHMCAVPGVLNGARFLAVDGWPRYLALYDLESPATLTSDGYRAVTGKGFSPWTRRVLARVRGWQRLAFDQVHPGAALLHPECRAIALHHFSTVEAAETAGAAFDGDPGALQVRVFAPAAQGPAAVIVESGSIAGLPPLALGARRLPASVVNASVWAARLVRYTRTNPMAAFHDLEASGSP